MKFPQRSRLEVERVASPSPRHNVPPVAAEGWPRGRRLRWRHNVGPQAEV